jgi:ArsR family transcriptional regulator
VDDSAVIEMCRALGDPVRWSVVSELRRGTRCACELAGASGAAPSLLSHHLGVLRDAGLVTAQRRGRWIDYTLVNDRIEEVAAAFFEVAMSPDTPEGLCDANPTRTSLVS